MPDQRQIAWKLLTPEERPKGVRLSNLESQFLDPHDLLLPRFVAYDRLCQAVEGVLLDNFWHHAQGEPPEGGAPHHCWMTPGKPWVWKFDRLTAANYALEAERGSDGR